MSKIIPTAEPFFFQGNKTGCLLVHGFTGTPKEMRWMGEYLTEQGFSVLGVRLAGHATTPEDMIRSRYQDWIASVEDGYHLLSSVADRIYLIGLSMGGVLSLLMSTRLPVRGLVAMATPYAIPPGKDKPVWLYRVISKLIPYEQKSKDEPGSGWFDKDAFQEHISYSQNPIRAAAELKMQLAEMRAALPEVDVPALLIHSKDDPYVLPENMTRIFDDLGTEDKDMLWVEGGGHVITRDATRQQVFQAAAEFIQRVEEN